jgi:hypothetical protein
MKRGYCDFCGRWRFVKAFFHGNTILWLCVSDENIADEVDEK